MTDRHIPMRERTDQSLDATDHAVLSRLAKSANPKGLAVRNQVVERFGHYEHQGLVKLSGCRVGPLGLADQDNFWARLTDVGRDWVANFVVRNEPILLPPTH